MTFPPVFATLLLLLQVAPVCHVDPFDLSDIRMWRLLSIVLDAASNRFRSGGGVVEFKLFELLHP
jgi:hypothetical protein